MSETAKVQANSAFGRVTLKAGMMEQRKNSPNPKRRNHETAENTPKS